MADGTREIVDPHHHLWGPTYMDGMAGQYLLDDLREDTDTVPGVVQTMFMECGASYRTEGPEHLRPVGETAFVAAMAETSERTPGAVIAGIVGAGDLTLPIDLLDELLDAHAEAAGGRFRGIRDALACAPPDTPLLIPGSTAPGRAAEPDFRRGVAHLGERGLTYDTWHYHLQCDEFAALARAVPGTTMVLDHLATPLGVGPWAGRHDEIFPRWQQDMADLATCENVVAKLGGLAMPDNGFFGIDGTARPDVDGFLEVQERWYLHMIDCFGPQRCMFESNFPVDKLCVDYAVVWEAFDRIADRYDAAEQEALFAGTARRVYQLPDAGTDAP